MMVQGAPANPINALSGARAARQFVIAVATGASFGAISAIMASVISSPVSIGSSFGPSPVINLTLRPRAHGTIRMSEKIIAASNPKRSIGCNVTSTAFSGFRQKEIKSGSDARTALYSARYLPACRMSQRGRSLDCWPDNVLRKRLVMIRCSVPLIIIDYL